MKSDAVRKPTPENAPIHNHGGLFILLVFALCIAVLFVFNMAASFLFLRFSILLVQNRPEYFNYIFLLLPAFSALIFLCRRVGFLLPPLRKFPLIVDAAIFIIWELACIKIAYVFWLECIPLLAHTIWLHYYSMTLMIGQKRWLQNKKRSWSAFGVFAAIFVFIFFFNPHIFFTYSGGGKLRKNEDTRRVSVLMPSKLSEINSLGLRGHELSVKKPAGVIRVACMGDSSTYGWLLPEEQTYPRILETLLKLQKPADYQVVNGGVLGNDSTDGLNMFMEKIQALDPDIVTVYYGVNRDRKNPLKYRESITSLIELCRKKHIKIVLMTYPNARRNEIENINSVIKKLSRETGTPLLDLDEYFYGGKNLSYYFFDHVHPNATGQRIIAEQMARFLSSDGMRE